MTESPGDDRGRRHCLCRQLHLNARGGVLSSCHCSLVTYLEKDARAGLPGFDNLFLRQHDENRLWAIRGRHRRHFDDERRSTAQSRDQADDPRQSGTRMTDDGHAA
jgi:hypothetical protein